MGECFDRAPGRWKRITDAGSLGNEWGMRETVGTSNNFTTRPLGEYGGGARERNLVLQRTTPQNDNTTHNSTQHNRTQR